jgi:hypothetical protein
MIRSSAPNKPAAPLKFKAINMTMIPIFMVNPSPPRKSAATPTACAETDLLFLKSNTAPKLSKGNNIQKMNKVRNKGLNGGRESTIGVAIDTYFNLINSDKFFLFDLALCVYSKK